MTAPHALQHSCLKTPQPHSPRGEMAHQRARCLARRSAQAPLRHPRASEQCRKSSTAGIRAGSRIRGTPVALAGFVRHENRGPHRVAESRGIGRKSGCCWACKGLGRAVREARCADCILARCSPAVGASRNHGIEPLCSSNMRIRLGVRLEARAARLPKDYSQPASRPDGERRPHRGAEHRRGSNLNRLARKTAAHPLRLAETCRVICGGGR